MSSPDVQNLSAQPAKYYSMPQIRAKVTDLSAEQAGKVVMDVVHNGPSNIWSKLDFTESHFVRAHGFIFISKEAKFMSAEEFSRHINQVCSLHVGRIFLEGELEPRSVENCKQRDKDKKLQDWNDLVADPIFISRNVKDRVDSIQKKSKLQTSGLLLPMTVRILTIAGFASAFYFRETRAGECFALGTATFAVISHVRGLDVPKQNLASFQLRRLRLGTFTAATLAVWNFVHYVAKPLAKMNIRFVSRETLGKLNTYIKVAALVVTGALVTYGLEKR